MANIISGYDNNAIYKHSGFSTTTTANFSNPYNPLYGLGSDGTNVLSVAYGSTVAKFTGFSNTVAGTVGGVSNNIGVGWDSANLLIAIYTSPGVIQKRTGFSSTITTSLTLSTNEAVGAEWDGTNLLSTSSSTDKAYKYSGFSNTISTEVSLAANMRDLAWDGTNLYFCSNDTSKIYKKVGFSSTASGEIASVRSGSTGLAWDDWGGAAAPTTTIKKFMGVSQDSIKNAEGVAIASVKKLIGVANS